MTHESHELILEAIRHTREDLGNRMDLLTTRVSGLEQRIVEQNGRVRGLETWRAGRDGHQQGVQEASTVQRVEVQDRRQRLAPVWQLAIALIGVAAGAGLTRLWL